jgi:hypothetical protein
MRGSDMKSLPRTYSFPQEEDQVWIYIYDTVEIEDNLICWNGKYMTFHQEGKDLIPGTKFQLHSKAVEVNRMIICQDGGVLARVDSEIVWRSDCI